MCFYPGMHTLTHKRHMCIYIYMCVFCRSDIRTHTHIYIYMWIHTYEYTYFIEFNIIRHTHIYILYIYNCLYLSITLNHLLCCLQEPGSVVEPRDLSSSLNAADAASTVGYSQGEVESAETGTSFTAPESVVMADPKETVYDQVLAEIKCILLQIWFFL